MCINSYPNKEGVSGEWIRSEEVGIKNQGMQHTNEEQPNTGKETWLEKERESTFET